jgi:hypothetical protein
MLGNRVMRRIVGHKRSEAIAERRKLHKKASSNISRKLKLRNMRWEEEVTRMRDEKCVQNFN